ncbi:hypothetical protein Acr_00g0061050 [Actinidia rufa]|uniref:Uncharacterized protein n=1 Tax=Actinidia rufa TaxID=165716 RepID=A0A7J0DQF9_9ERIC|nr:hypothetical protein Acr_00g0061050 [Actinidia rufa]
MKKMKFEPKKSPAIPTPVGSRSNAKAYGKKLISRNSNALLEAVPTLSRSNAPLGKFQCPIGSRSNTPLEGVPTLEPNLRTPCLAPNQGNQGE